MAYEILDILDDEGNATGETAHRNDVHRDGLWHAAIHAWCFNGQGDLLLRKRGPRLARNPGKWDLPVRGHVLAGESPEEAVLRLVQERLGVPAIGQPEEIMLLQVEEYVPELSRHENEFKHVFICQLDARIADLHFDKRRTSSLMFISQEQLRFELSRQATRDQYVERYYKDILKSIPLMA